MTDNSYLNLWPPFFGEEWQATLGYVLSPDAKKIIDYIQAQIDTHKPKEPDRNEWEWLESYIEEARQHLANGQIDRACSSFFQVGMVARDIMSISPETVDWLSLLATEAIARRKPLDDRNQKIKIAKASVRQIAKKNWEADSNDSIRTSEMAEIVWNELKNLKIDPEQRAELKKVLPGKSEGLKPWIRKDAPTYASRSGRPRKK